MTFDERLAELGVDLSDLPQGDGKHLVYDRTQRIQANRAQREWHGIGEYGLVDIVDETRMLEDYILHLTDIIDRMETRLTNVTQERDWLVDLMKMRCACDACEFRDTDGPECDACYLDGPGFVYGGVPEEDRR